VINLILNDAWNFQMIRGDSMQDPILDGGHLKKFPVAMANPLWADDNWGREFLENDPYNRNLFGLPARRHPGWMWVQHLWAGLDDGGRMAVVLDRGCLFRGHGEYSIRRGFVCNDWLEGVILLPENIFSKTKVGGCILVFNKQKMGPMIRKVMFINAQQKYARIGSKNQIQQEHIMEIINAYKNLTIVDGFSALLSIDEIGSMDNDYDLGVHLYIGVIQISPENQEG
jgi:type I restriction enzyme M protein